MTGTPFPLFHWSPSRRRGQITRRGLIPGSRSRDGLWRPPYVCFSDSPSLAWALSGGMPDTEPEPWDLWLMWSTVPTGYEEVTDTDRETGQPYVKEVRVYERIYKRDLWLVGVRDEASW